MKKNIVYVTGAFGFIGRNVSKHFADKGWEVIGISREPWQSDEFSQWGIKEYYAGNVTQDILKKIGKTPEVIVHCAGGSSVGFSVENPEADYEMTIGSAKQVLEFIRINCSKARLIYPSSAAVYGQKEDFAIKEEDAIEPVSPYGEHKKIVEDLCEEYSKRYNLNISIARLFSIYGPGLRKQLLWDASCKLCGDGEKAVFFGTGSEKRDWVHVSDIAELFFVLAISKNRFEIVNGGSGIGVTIKDVLNELAVAFSTDKKIIFNGISKEGDPKYYTADIQKAKALGWKPKISLESGIMDYVNFFKNEND